MLKQFVVVFYGLLLGLTSPGLPLSGYLWPWVWVGLLPWFRSILSPQSHSTRRLCHSFIFGTVYHAIFLCWVLGLHPLTWVGLNPLQSAWVTVGAWALWSILGGVLWLVLGEALRALYQLINPSTLAGCWGIALLFGLAWVLVQQGYPSLVNWYVPWASLSLSQVTIPLIQPLFQYLPPGGVTALIITINTGLAFQWHRPHAANKVVYSTISILIGLAIISNVNTPSIAHTSIAPFNFEIWQGNLPIGIIRNPKAQPSHSTRYVNALANNTDIKPDTTLLWPEEGAIFGVLNPIAPKKHPQYDKLQQWVNHRLPQGQLIFGLTTVQPTSRPSNYYNSLIHVPPQQSQSSKTLESHLYHKQHLVPFGETVPSGLAILPSMLWPTLMQWLQVPYIPRLSKGQRAKPFNLSDSIKLGPMICFEITQSQLAQHYKHQGVDALFNSANLGWFHHHPTLAQQYLRYGQLRALETGLPVLISANSGPSAIIDAQGQITKQLSVNQSGILIHEMTPSKKSSTITARPFPDRSP